MKVGYYVRTSSGKIVKCFKSESMNKPIYYVIGSATNSYIEYQDVVKSSPNIIDLIEVGDYVNGFEVLRIDKDCNLYPKTLKCQYPNNTDYFDIFNEDIKSIVTKEQFEQMKYRVED